MPAHSSHHQSFPTSTNPSAEAPSISLTEYEDASWMGGMGRIWFSPLLSSSCFLHLPSPSSFPFLVPTSLSFLSPPLHIPLLPLFLSHVACFLIVPLLLYPAPTSFPSLSLYCSCLCLILSFCHSASFYLYLSVSVSLSVVSSLCPPPLPLRCFLS